MYGPVVEQRIWIIGTSHKSQGLYKDLDVAADIKKKRLEWIGHSVRIYHGWVVKRIFESKPEGRRRMGGSRLRWLVDVEKDLWEMKVKRW